MQKVHLDCPQLKVSQRFIRIGFAAFRVRREATLFHLDEQKDFQLGDLTITAGAQANVTLTDNTAFYYLSYNLFNDNRNSVMASFGLYGLDLKYRLDASGQISVQGNPLVQDSYTAKAEVFAPLPLFGIDAWCNFTPKWALGTKLSLVGGTYEDITAGVVATSVRARYKISKLMGFIFGIEYFMAEVTIDEPALRTEVDYGYTAVALGLDFRI